MNREGLLTPEQAMVAGESEVGGKAMGLGRLHEANVRVPPWQVVPSEVFQDHLCRALSKARFDELGGKISELDPDDPNNAEIFDVISTEVREAIEKHPLDEAVTSTTVSSERSFFCQTSQFRALYIGLAAGNATPSGYSFRASREFGCYPFWLLPLLSWSWPKAFWIFSKWGSVVVEP